MFFTYWASVVLISLAIYGILCLMYDLWGRYMQTGFRYQASVSLLILVKDREQDIEMLVYDLTGRMERSRLTCDAVIVDCGSDDLTYDILSRMRELSPALDVVRLAGSLRPVSEALPLCRGEIIHVLDLTCRLSPALLIPAVDRLLWQGAPGAD